MTTPSAAPLTVLQAEVEQWAERYWGGEYWPPLANLARLTEEVDEVARDQPVTRPEADQG